MKLTDLPKEVRDELERDKDIYGDGFAIKEKGMWKRVDPANMIMIFDKEGNFKDYKIKKVKA